MSAGVGYRIQSTVLVNEPRSIRAGGDVGYRITGRLNVGAIWDGGNGDKMLRFEVKKYEIYVIPTSENNVRVPLELQIIL